MTKTETLSFTGKFTQFLMDLLISAIERVVPQIKERRIYLERALDHDQVTDLANRAAFDRARKTAEEDRKTAFVVFDCNNFGLVNKTLGHAKGDELLFSIASEIKRACFANQARSFRYGGDEFVVLVNKRFAVSLRDAIEKRVGVIDYDGFEVSISGTVGKTFEQADAALQQRKREAKNGGR